MRYVAGDEGAAVDRVKTVDAGAFFVVKENWQARGCGAHKDPTAKWFWQGDYEQGVADKGYQELYVLWLQLACFLPVFRSHGTDTPREIRNFGKKGEMVFDALEKTIKLRYRLMPYVYSLAGNVWLKNGMMMRPLLFDFAQDKKAVARADEFMFGPSLLVCPFLRAQVPLFLCAQRISSTPTKSRRAS